MNRFYSTLVALIFFKLWLGAQNYDKAIVTDVVFFRQTNIGVTSLSFPFYFYQKGFVADVQGDIARFLQKKFLVDSIEFSKPDSIFYYAGFYPLPLQTRQKAKQHRQSNILYVSVETIVQQGVTANYTETFRFVTTLRIYNGKGRLYYRFKNVIPFEPYAGDYIAGETKMSETDFYVFYFDGIKNVFDGTDKHSDKRYVEKPLAEKYNAFAREAEKFYWAFSGQGTVLKSKFFSIYF
ncbi:MAG: hypothetical protein JXB34_07670 [Bacteroidales bacterium]|nr:hypothetical protein [Bacteroidales bacterium]